MSDVNVTPTILKHVARSLKVPGLNGISGKALIASHVRSSTPFSEGSDGAIILSYFSTLGKPSVPNKYLKTPRQLAWEAKMKIRQETPATTSATNLGWAPVRPIDVAPWE